MIGADIGLTLEGASILRNGDLAIDDQLDLAFTNRMLRSSRGSWEFDPDIGIGLQDFAGQENTEENGVAMQQEIDDGLRGVGVTSRTVVYPTSQSEVAINITVFTTQGAQTVGFGFNYEEGLVSYIRTEVDTGAFQTRESLNKYDRRSV